MWRSALTHGVASLMILALFDWLNVAQGEGFAHVHRLVEATKQAFIRRNREPTTMAVPAQRWLDAADLDRLAGRIDATRALPWPRQPADGDTI
jgi:gamma-glutamyltranspeptidase/glutathione hydrolase